VYRPARAAYRWITGRGCRQPSQDVTSTLRMPGADGAIPTMRRRRRPTPGRAAHHLPNPPWARTAIEDLLAGLPARATCLLAGALMPRLISAFVATPHPGPAIGPARHPAGLTKAQPCGGSTRSRSPVIVRSM
jgi:hypothetical protein